MSTLSRNPVPVKFEAPPPPYAPCAVIVGRIASPSDSWGRCGKLAAVVGVLGSILEGVTYCAEHAEVVADDSWRSHFVPVPR